MLKTPINLDLNILPLELATFIGNKKAYDSSCSPEARVYFIEKDNGYYLKRAPKGALQREVEVTEFFYKNGLGTNVLSYVSAEFDWMLSEKVPGEDCTFKLYLDNPKKLCDTISTLLRSLHETDFSSCPIADRTGEYIKTVLDNYKSGEYDKSAFPDSFGYRSAEEAFAVANENMKFLKSDTLIHGDYCLPNIMLNDWKFSKFIDLGNGGVGDRHIDIFWGIWTLYFNLKTDRYTSRFIDGYGRDKIEPDLLKTVAACEVFG